MYSANYDDVILSARPRFSLRSRAVLSLILAFAFLGPYAYRAASQDSHHRGTITRTVNFPISCSAPAQAEFNQAVTLLHHMTYPQARIAFEKVASIDPDCAMAHWGIAMTLFQPLWPTRPRPDALRRGWEAVEKAELLKPSAGPEAVLIAAARAFFKEPESSDYWLRIRRWENSMESAYRAFPDDQEVMAFYALAHLAITPPDKISRANADIASEILVRVYRRDPGHPGAMHYLVHANDVPGRENELLEITREYESVAPNNPHALHMPTHIYTRLGDWNGVIRGNLRAAQAALAHPAGERGEYIWDEFPHAIEYLVYAYLQKGDYRAAELELKRLDGTANVEPTFKTAFHSASTRSRFALERRAWKEAAGIVPRMPGNLDWDRFAWPEAIGRFARGLGSAHLGRLDEARGESKIMESLENRTRRSGEELFARNIRILRLELDAWITHSGGDKERAVSILQEAIELEASTPKHAVTPGPTIPAEELLGDLLFAQRNFSGALSAYERSLEKYPNRFNSLLGAARSADKAGERTVARKFYGRLLEVADKGAAGPAGVKEARTYIRKH